VEAGCERSQSQRLCLQTFLKKEKKKVLTTTLSEEKKRGGRPRLCRGEQIKLC